MIGRSHSIASANTRTDFGNLAESFVEATVCLVDLVNEFGCTSVVVVICGLGPLLEVEHGLCNLIVRCCLLVESRGLLGQRACEVVDLVRCGATHIVRHTIHAFVEFASGLVNSSMEVVAGSIQAPLQVVRGVF